MPDVYKRATYLLLQFQLGRLTLAELLTEADKLAEQMKADPASQPDMPWPSQQGTGY